MDLQTLHKCFFVLSRTLHLTCTPHELLSACQALLNGDRSHRTFPNGRSSCDTSDLSEKYRNFIPRPCKCPRSSNSKPCTLKADHKPSTPNWNPRRCLYHLPKGSRTGHAASAPERGEGIGKGGSFRGKVACLGLIYMGDHNFSASAC